MAKGALSVTGFVMRGDSRIKREELPVQELVRLANTWNDLAMEEAGYVRVQMGPKKEVKRLNE
jgi:hypothetical protein